MYIRRVTRKNKDGSKVSYIQLAHNVWDPKAKYAKAKVIYSFGREDELDMAVLERLAQSINRFLTPEEALKSKQKLEIQLNFYSGLSSNWVAFGYLINFGKIGDGYDSRRDF
jgi:hypothetical protein